MGAIAPFFHTGTFKRPVVNVKRSNKSHLSKGSDNGRSSQGGDSPSASLKGILLSVTRGYQRNRTSDDPKKKRVRFEVPDDADVSGPIDAEPQTNKRSAEWLWHSDAVPGGVLCREQMRLGFLAFGEFCSLAARTKAIMLSEELVSEKILDVCNHPSYKVSPPTALLEGEEYTEGTEVWASTRLYVFD